MPADFLWVQNRRYPTAKFVSKAVNASDNVGMLNVVGDFTLMGETNEITIPVSLEKVGSGVLMKGEFCLNRAHFGMDKMAETVANDVSITLSVGEQTTGKVTGRGGRSSWDPTEYFNGRDFDGDGKLVGHELSDRMRDRVRFIDSDGDRAITLEELKKAAQNSPRRVTAVINDVVHQSTTSNWVKN